MNRHILAALSCFVLMAPSSQADELEILRSRYLQAKPQTIRAVTQPGERLPLRLFDDVQIDATLDSIENDPLNGYVWRGHIEEIPGSWAVLVENKGCIAGTISGVDSYYRIRCLGGGIHAIDEVVPPEPIFDDAVEADSWGESYQQVFRGNESNLEDDEIVELDVMVIYTRRAAKKLVKEIDTGHTRARQAMKSQIQLSVAIANTALENSGVNLRLRLVKSRAINYKASGDSTLDLSYLAKSDDGIIDKVHVWRDRYGADFVSMVLEDFEKGVGARGYFATPDHVQADRLLFSVLRYDLLWWVILAHELGHNMGLAHDRDNDFSSPHSKSYKYSHGHRDPPGGFRTIMSYKKGCDSCRWMLPHFSNKDIRWEGAPSGSPGFQPRCGDGVNTGPKCGRRTGTNKANSALSLNQTRAFFAEIRACQVSCGN